MLKSHALRSLCSWSKKEGWGMVDPALNVWRSQLVLRDPVSGFRAHQTTQLDATCYVKVFLSETYVYWSHFSKWYWPLLKRSVITSRSRLVMDVDRVGPWFYVHRHTETPLKAAACGWVFLLYNAGRQVNRTALKRRGHDDAWWGIDAKVWLRCSLPSSNLQENK